MAPETADELRAAWEHGKALWSGAFRTPADVIAFVDGLLAPAPRAEGEHAHVPALSSRGLSPRVPATTARVAAE